MSNYDGPERRQEELEEEHARRIRGAVGALLLFLCVVLTGLSIANSIRSGNTADEAKALAEKVEAIATAAKELGEDIQASRFEFYVTECEDLNKRHDNTLAIIDDVVARTIENHPEREGSIKRQVQDTIFLIDALVPVTKNCEKKARKIIKLEDGAA